MARTVADQTAEVLARAGVERIYGVVGDSLNGLIDALRRQDKIRWIPVRHEEAAAFAAGAEAQATGKLAVCAGSCGPGNMHLINGLYDCHRSRAPVLAIAAQIPAPEIGSNYFQETRPQSLFRDCSAYCESISCPEQAARVLQTAIREAWGAPGVGVVVASGDVMLQEAEKARLATEATLMPPRSVAHPSPASVEELAALLNGARRVTLLCGSGCAGARPHLLALAERLGSPVVHALRGKEFVEADNPFDVGMTGLIGFSSGWFAMNDCDVLLMLGTDFPYRQFYPGGDARIAQVDVRAGQIGRRTPVDVAVVGDVGATVAALLPKLDEKRDRDWLDKALAHYRKARAELDGLARGAPGRRPIHPQQVAKAISDLAAPDAIFTCDVGLPTVWAARYLSMTGSRRLLGSFWHGSMANALSQAMGAQAAFPARQVVALCGDGGFSMLLGDLLTLKPQKLPVKAVVFDNSTLGFVELEQKAGGFVDAGTTLDNPDFAALAEAAGVKGIRLEDPGEVEQKLAEALAHDGPVIVDAVVARQELAMPPHVTAEMAKGFTLFMLKAVLDGRGGELVDLARTNLWR
jgi:pyruvate dehydrogenase (quinone)